MRAARCGPGRGAVPSADGGRPERDRDDEQHEEHPDDQGERPEIARSSRLHRCVPPSLTGSRPVASSIDAGRRCCATSRSISGRDGPAPASTISVTIPMRTTTSSPAPSKSRRLGSIVAVSSSQRRQPPSAAQPAPYSTVIIVDSPAGRKVDLDPALGQVALRVEHPPAVLERVATDRASCSPASSSASRYQRRDLVDAGRRR